MTITMTEPESPAAELDIEIIADVNDAAEVATGLGCGDDNPYSV